MGSRRLATLFILFALVAKLVSPCEASAAVALGAPDAAIAKCHFLAQKSSAQGESKPAPSGDLDHEACACALCHIGWSTLPPTDNLFVIQGLAHHVAPRAPPAQSFVPSQQNRSASPRGPPSFA
ncbi:MAG: hypothetical protein U1E20_09940 [Methylocystis sp.]|uniref:DUF2946 family protein n=1 Tax=Methylocystis sp. TaxID=1911079 RepID=UPI00392037C1